MLLALIIKLFQKMWPKLGRERSWRVSMHAPFGNFAWAPHHCRGARGGYESLLHPGVTWRFFHLLASGCAFPVLLNSSWYHHHKCALFAVSQHQKPHLRVAVERKLLAGSIREALCSSDVTPVRWPGMLHSAFHTWNGTRGSSWLGGAGLSREIKTCNSYCDKEHLELFLQSFLCPLSSLWLLDHNPLHLVPRIQLNAIYCHMFE